MKRNILFLILYIMLYAFLFYIFNAYIGDHYYFGIAFLDLSFVALQSLVLFPLFIINILIFNGINYKTGGGCIFLSFLGIIIYHLLGSPVEIEFIINYILSVKGFFFVETPIILAFIFSLEISKLVTKYFK